MPAVEIAESSLHVDLKIKAGIYARAGIADYRVLDLKRRRLIVPCALVNGTYKKIVGYEEHEEAAPDKPMKVAEALYAPQGGEPNP